MKSEIEYLLSFFLLSFSCVGPPLPTETPPPPHSRLPATVKDFESNSWIGVVMGGLNEVTSDTFIYDANIGPAEYWNRPAIRHEYEVKSEFVNDKYKFSVYEFRDTGQVYEIAWWLIDDDCLWGTVNDPFWIEYHSVGKQYMNNVTHINEDYLDKNTFDEMWKHIDEDFCISFSGESLHYYNEFGIADDQTGYWVFSFRNADLGESYIEVVVPNNLIDVPPPD